MRDQLKQLLLSRAISEARNMGYSFSSQTESDLRELISDAVDSMSYSQYLSPVDNLRALNNTDILIRRVAENARSRQIGDRLDQKSLADVRGTICPLWPFC